MKAERYVASTFRCPAIFFFKMIKQLRFLIIINCLSKTTENCTAWFRNLLLCQSCRNMWTSLIILQNSLDYQFRNLILSVHEDYFLVFYRYQQFFAVRTVCFYCQPELILYQDHLAVFVFLT